MSPALSSTFKARAGTSDRREAIARVIQLAADGRPDPPMPPGKLDAINRVGRFGYPSVDRHVKREGAKLPSRFVRTLTSNAERPLPLVFNQPLNYSPNASSLT